MNVLLHTCCAPCASHCVLTLQALGHDVTLFYSNANIAPPEEFLKRLDAVRLLAVRVSVPLLIDEPDHDAWLREAGLADAVAIDTPEEGGLPKVLAKALRRGDEWIRTRIGGRTYRIEDRYYGSDLARWNAAAKAHLAAFASLNR